MEYRAGSSHNDLHPEAEVDSSESVDASSTHIVGYDPEKDQIVVKKRRRFSNRIPYGFDVDPNDPSLFIPNIEQYKVIIEARKMRKAGCSYRACADYIAAHGDRKFSAMDTMRIINREY